MSNEQQQNEDEKVKAIIEEEEKEQKPREPRKTLLVFKEPDNREFDPQKAGKRLGVDYRQGYTANWKIEKKRWVIDTYPISKGLNEVYKPKEFVALLDSKKLYLPDNQDQTDFQVKEGFEEKVRVFI